MIRFRQDSIPFLALGLALLALVLAIVVLFVDPANRGLAAYDLDTPRDALVAEAKMQAKKDARALMELDMLRSGRDPEAMAETLKIEREQTFQGKKILFVTWEEDGVEKHGVRAVEKDAETGYWIPAHFPRDAELEQSDPQLAQNVRSWELEGRLR
jgi:hypothetical protein